MLSVDSVGDMRIDFEVFGKPFIQPKWDRLQTAM